MSKSMKILSLIGKKLELYPDDTYRKVGYILEMDDTGILYEVTEAEKPKDKGTYFINNSCKFRCKVIEEPELKPIPLDLEQDWKTYKYQNYIDGLFFYDPDKEILVTVYEGTGDNLLNEDIDEGYLDYWNVDVYHKGEGLIGGGLMLLKELIITENPTLSSIIDKIMRNAEMFDGLEGLDLKAMSIVPSQGQELEHEFME